MSDDARFEDLLTSLSDDTPADWAATHGGEDVAALCELARIAEFHRSRQREVRTEAPAEWGTLLLLERLGAGSRGEVWRAWDRALRREVALKLVRTGALGAAVAEPALLEEARAAARVSHPHVVVVHGVARHGDHAGLWMEYVRGTSLAAHVREAGPLPAGTAVGLAADIAGALAALHDAGVLHRDVKPANLLEGTDGRWVLADFGLGVSRDRRDLPASPSAGTPMYLAPELFRGEPHSAASDQYALALTLWFALSGSDAFPAVTIGERAKVAEGPVPSLVDRCPGIDARLAAIVTRALAVDPGARYPGTKAFEQALRRWLATSETAPPARARRAKAWLALAVIPAVVLAAALVLRHEPRDRPPATTAPLAPEAYEVSGQFVRRSTQAREALSDGMRVRPGDRLTFELEVSRTAWAYVLNEDERGERWLLFPQPRFDTRNPLPAGSTVTLPGTVAGAENAWIVTSRGVREHFLVVVSPEPVAELEAELGRLPAPSSQRPVSYARVGEVAIERLRGVGGVAALTVNERRAPAAAGAFDRFRSLAGRETGVRGVWVRQFTLANP